MDTSSDGPARHTGALARLARACAFHPWRTIGIWVAVIFTVGAAAAMFGGTLVNEFKIPGSESKQASDLLSARFPERAGDAAQIVVQTNGSLTDEAARDGVAAAQAAAKKIPGVVAVGDPYARKGGAISKDGHIGYFDAQFATPAAEVDESVVNELEDSVTAAAEGSPLDVEFGGPVANSTQPPSEASEVIGIVAAMIVLLVVLGSAVAMAVPITLALVSVGLGMSLLTLAAALTDFNKVTPTLAVMIGLGVGIDYSLFIVTRFRQALADGAAPRDAAVTAASTAGRAVIFAGTTVAISISGLMVVGIPFVTKLGIGAAMTVIGAVFTAITLLPAILSKLGHRINSAKLPRIGRTKPTTSPEH